MSEIVLDASALIAMLKGEKGADKVAGAIADARICTVNYAEVVTHFIHLGMPEREVDAMLDPLPMTIEADRLGIRQPIQPTDHPECLGSRALNAGQ